MHSTQNIKKLNKLLGYFPYIDDILLVYDYNATNINDLLHDLNQISQSLHFTVETECNKVLSIRSVNF